MLAEGARFLEHADLYITEIAASLVVGLDQSRQRNCAGEPRRPATDEEHIHRDCFRIRRLRQDQSIERKRSLMDYRKDFTSAIRHQWCFLASRTASVRAGITSNTSPTI